MDWEQTHSFLEMFDLVWGRCVHSWVCLNGLEINLFIPGKVGWIGNKCVHSWECLIWFRINVVIPGCV